MKIILLDEVKGLGKKYDVKDIADGYARNYLIPRKLAKPATVSSLKEVELLKVQQAKEEADTVKRLSELARHVSEHSLTFELKSDDKRTVFGSVTKEMILKAMREHHWVTKERVEIKLEHPIKEFGGHLVPVTLKKGITAKLRVIVRPQT